MLASLLKRVGIRPPPTVLLQDSKRPGDGPPDLDQMWRDFNQRLNRLFGPKGPGGGDTGGGGYRPDMKGAGITVGAAAAVVAFIWLASGVFSVLEGQVGIVSTFGKYARTTGPGLNWRMPYPFQTHEKVNVSNLRTVEIGTSGTVRAKNPQEALMLTDDENIIEIQFAVQYTLKDPKAWLFNNYDTDDTVRMVAETSMREIVGKSKMDFVLYEGREKVALDTQLLMQKIIDRYALGAQINNVTMQVVQPPEQVQGAFDDAVKAGQDRERAKNEGQAYANDVVPRARGNAFRLMQEAEAYRSMVTENATGNAARFSQVMTEYQKAPAITRDRMYLDTMQQIFTSASKVMVDAKSGSNLLYLPLDKLISQTAANDAAVGAKSGPVQAAPLPLPTEVLQPLEQVRQRDNRSRESSRDREIR
ncbi:FtsH protease activity modulator HflK [Massilia scottii]|uniref:FtsH protease activity modulator HflK n=1 Tax=Massilia scottii TaxID=3057166 RepID=UPI002796D01C|nr:FtsH protease activity modulator HflK [Massilia sp. CCM 9029]MDQ1832505.1 FtsH protease activity modulator HflK [Massilia sp. CCM 9029]